MGCERFNCERCDVAVASLVVSLAADSPYGPMFVEAVLGAAAEQGTCTESGATDVGQSWSSIEELLASSMADDVGSSVSDMRKRMRLAGAILESRLDSLATSRLDSLATSRLDSLAV